MRTRVTRELFKLNWNSERGKKERKGEGERGIEREKERKEGGRKEKKRKEKRRL